MKDKININTPIMDVKQFDKWYDVEIEKIIKRLSDANKYSNPTIAFPVNFSEPYFFNSDNLSQNKNRIRSHIVEFRKVRHEFKPGYKWVRC